ncbi:hypothetical protein [Microbulbifer variabilis]|uniref:hypothetical protein n=1 Tax=Microbulbifer variabilis TaxID=266805 RepID=UPI0003826CD2|nr:hypothetical protein [Microbulbifer variabilis]
MSKLKYGIIMILACLLVTSCATYNQKEIVNTYLAKKDTSYKKFPIKNLFSYANDCKNQGENEFCSCVEWAKDSSGKLPKPEFGLVDEEKYMDQALSALMDYFDKLESCEVFAPISIDFEVPANTAVAERILLENQDEILTPENSSEIENIQKEIGWTFKVSSVKKKPSFTRGSFVYTGRVGDQERFDYSGSDSKYAYINGVRHFLDKKWSPNKFKVSGLGECKFVLGECIYGPPGDRKKVFTVFENGVWIHNVGALSIRHRMLKKMIYDRSGIPLYEYWEKPNFTYEAIRHEKNIFRVNVAGFL